MAIRPLQVGPPSSPPDTQPSSSIEKRYALLPISCSNTSIQNIRVAKPTLNSITCARTFSLPAGASHCEHRARICTIVTHKDSTMTRKRHGKKRAQQHYYHRFGSISVVVAEPGPRRGGGCSEWGRGPLGAHTANEYGV